jgi:hypothetical protein
MANLSRVSIKNTTMGRFPQILMYEGSIIAKKLAIVYIEKSTVTSTTKQNPNFNFHFEFITRIN